MIRLDSNWAGEMEHRRNTNTSGMQIEGQRPGPSFPQDTHSQAIMRQKGISLLFFRLTGVCFLAAWAWASNNLRLNLSYSNRFNHLQLRVEDHIAFWIMDAKPESCGDFVRGFSNEISSVGPNLSRQVRLIFLRYTLQ